MPSKNKLLDEIRKLNAEINDLKSDLEWKELELSKFKDPKRRCSEACKVCEHSYLVGYNPFTGYTYGCVLDVTCSDFKRSLSKFDINLRESKG